MTKTFDELLSDLMAAVTAKTPFTNMNPSAALRGVLEAFASAISGLYQLIRTVSGSLFVQTATGGWLDLKAREVGMQRLAGQKTRMWVKIRLNAVNTGGEVQIPAGTCVRSRKDAAGHTYRFFTVNGDTISEGEIETHVLVEAEAIGAAYNVGEGTVTVLVTSIGGVESVINESFNGTNYMVLEGANAESDRVFRERCITKWDTLSVNGTRAAYYNWALSVPGVKSAMVLDDAPYGPGTVGVVIVGTAGVPTAQLLHSVTEYIRPRKPLTSLVQVTGATAVDLSLELLVTTYATADGETVAASVRDTALLYASCLQLGEGFLLARFVAAMLQVDGVYNLQVTSHTEDVAAGPTEFIRFDEVIVSHQVKRRAYQDASIDERLGSPEGTIPPLDRTLWGL